MRFLLGFFLPMLVILGCVFVQQKTGWILYLVGAGLLLLSLLGRAKQAAMFAQYGIVDRSVPIMWIIYIVILVVGAAVICARRSRMD